MSRRTRVILAALCFCAATGAIALRMAWATPGVGVASTIISGPVSFEPFNVVSTTPMNFVHLQSENDSDVYVVTVTIAPGGQTGWHAHPGPAFVSVKSGVATEYHGNDADCTPVVHLPGTGFMETTGHVHDVRNEGNVPLELVILFIVPPGSPTRLDMPNPGNCPF